MPNTQSISVHIHRQDCISGKLIAMGKYESFSGWIQSSQSVKEAEQGLEKDPENAEERGTTGYKGMFQTCRCHL